MEVNYNQAKYKDKCTIIVSSCDKYSEAWLPFFSLLEKNWPDCPFEKVLVTESKQCDLPQVRTITAGDCVWSERIHKALNSVKTPTVLLFLEDFFLQARVREKDFLFYLDEMLKDDTIGAFYFNAIEGFKTPSVKYPDFYDMNQTNQTKYHLNCQIGLWNREVFLLATDKKITPWEFEIEGFDIVDPEIKNKKFYCSKNSVHTRITENDIFAYLLERSLGYGIWKSKWLWNNKKLFRKEGIKCDCSSLPTLTWREYHFNIIKSKVISFLSRVYHLFR